MQKSLFKVINMELHTLLYIWDIHCIFFWLYARYASSAVLITIVIYFARSFIIASKTPGWVTIFLQKKDGKELGETKIWYYDEDKEAVKRIIENPKLQTDFFRNYSEMLSNRNTTTASGAEAHNSGICGEWCIIECFLFSRKPIDANQDRNPKWLNLFLEKSRECCRA